MSGLTGVWSAKELPASWDSASLELVADLAPIAPGMEDAKERVAHFVPMAAVSEDFAGIDVSGLRPIDELRKGYTAFKAGDVLLAKITPCMENGKGGIVPPLPKEVAYGSTEFHVLRAKPAIRNDWLAYYLSQPAFREVAKSNMTGTAGQMRVPAKWLRTVEIPVPPYAEQARIVAKIEVLLSDLDTGVNELKAARQKLVHYRQALLKSAVEGTLTAEWRQQRQPSETGAQVLHRILQKRRARWETKQLAQFKERGKVPPKDWQMRYPEPANPDCDRAGKLPDGWVWATVAQLAELITSGSRGWADYYAASGAKFIRSQDIKTDWLDLSEVAFVNPPIGSEGARTSVQRDDVLLTITGANVGKTAHVQVDPGESFVSQHVALIRLVDASLAPFLHAYLTADAGGRSQLATKAYGAGKPGLNLRQVGEMIVPIASGVEVQALLKVLETQLTSLTTTEQAIDLALRQSTAQRQNILRAAFTGQLVPQDPTDEPASVLLERIRAEQADATPPRKPRRAARTKVDA